MKKYFIVFLVGALCLLVTGNFLIAGGTKDKEEKAVLTFWNHPVAADTAWEAQFWEETMTDFHSKHPDIQVNLVVQPVNNYAANASCFFNIPSDFQLYGCAKYLL